ncbi:MAG: hypothetical protein ABIE84_03380, partial [bacterium]
MSNRSAKERISDFKEVPLGFTPEQAKLEASRCIQCKKPLCVQGCPVEVDIPGFLKFVAQGDFESAVKKIKETNALPAVCGRVCPQEDQCEKKCILGVKGQAVAIGGLERFVADWERENEGRGTRDERRKPHPSSIVHRQSIKVAVVGSGPAGL